MTNTQLAALRASKMAVVLPGYVPSGFQVASVVVQPCRREDCRGLGEPGYLVVYRSPYKSCFAIRGTSGGIGDIDYEYEVPVETKLFGKTRLSFGSNINLPRKAPTSVQLQAPHAILLTDWFPLPGRGPFYSLISGNGYTYDDSGNPPFKPTPGCVTSITPQEAIQIVQSLEWLR
jgi:hypothetical protein